MTAGFDEDWIIIKNRSHHNDCGFESYRYINAILAFFRRLCVAYAETKSHHEYSVHW